MSIFHHLARAASTTSALALVAILSVVAAPLGARDFRVGELELLHPTAPPTPPGASSAAGYLVIVNGGDEDDRLLGGSAAFADDIEVHRTSVEDDVARMRRLDEGLVIPAGATVRLDPGATHLMFTGLVEALPDGGRVPATLAFARAGKVSIEFAVERPGDDAGEAVPMEHGEMEHGEAERDGTAPK